MNPIIKIINQIIIFINKLIDNLNKKTIETIKNSFYFFIFILIILGIYIGYKSGRHAAKMYGKPLTESTNNVFDVTIRKEQDRGQFRSMLETELIGESKEIQLRKIEFPTNERLKAESENKIIEINNDAQKETSLYIESEKIADIDRIEEKSKKPEVRELTKEAPKTKMEKYIKEVSPIDNELKIIEK